jgi:hypothetical protein
MTEMTERIPEMLELLEIVERDLLKVLRSSVDDIKATINAKKSDLKTKQLTESHKRSAPPMVKPPPSPPPPPPPSLRTPEDNHDVRASTPPPPTVQWYLTKHLQKRYGDCSRMSINRRVRQGRLPQPEFPFGNKIPAWRKDKLDAHDLAAVAVAAAKFAVQPAAEPASESVTEIAPIAEGASTRSDNKATTKVKSKGKSPVKPEPARPRGRPRRDRAVANAEQNEVVNNS